MRRVLALAVLWGAGPGWPGPGPEQAPALIVPAYVDQRELVFELPGALDWDTLLPPRLAPANLARDPTGRRQLYDRRSERNTTEVPFPLPLPSALRARFYYLWDSSGVREIRPTGLAGTARISWNADGSGIESVKAYGYLRSGTASVGGFVLVADRPTGLQSEASSLSADQLLAPAGGDYPGRGSPFRQIVRQYQIHQTSPSQDRWVFVQWLADTALVEAGCTYRFSLFHLTPEPAEVSSSDSGCDV